MSMTAATILYKWKVGVGWVKQKDANNCLSSDVPFPTTRTVIPITIIPHNGFSKSGWIKTLSVYLISFIKMYWGY